MKKVLILVLFTINVLLVSAQQYEVLHVEEFDSCSGTYCENDGFEGIIIYGEEYCPTKLWYVKMKYYYAEPGDWITMIWGESLDSIVINYGDLEDRLIYVSYVGCEFSTHIYFSIIGIPHNPFLEQVLWKRPNESVILDCDYTNGVWSTGEIRESIEVSEPGVYSVTMTNECGVTATYSVEVRDNVELYRATCDLVSNLNQVTWNTTPEQAEYVSAVKVYRNNQLVGTVPYSDGVFTDEIGSENTQWQYHIVAVSVEGDDCPIPSYWKRTIHLDCVQDSQGKMILQWTPYAEESPSKNEVTAYGIYDVVNGVPNHVIDVGNFTNVYAYNPADFHGYGAVAAVFAEDSLKRSDGFEKLAFSNRTKQMLGIDDIARNSIRVYPNPTDGEFTVEGVSDLTIYNILGQVVTKSHEQDGTHKLSLSSGIYFIKSDEGLVKKVIVE